MMKLEKYKKKKVMIILQVMIIIRSWSFKDSYRLIAVDLSKQKALDADPRVIQQIIFPRKASQNIVIYYILEQSKETILQYSKGATNVL